ncbi:MAG: phage gp6-like head-tail connector protein [Burkholderiaceae bacterium]|nr:MAG: phage gp6-like head-tail connector protein [Burkholderiaceae bacterium]
MPLLTLDQAREHVRAQGVPDDADLQLKVNAAELLVQEHAGRRIFESQQELDAAVAAGTAGDTTPMVVNDLVRSAMLLIVGHLYANREDVTTGAPVQLPSGARALIAPYRKGMGV